MSNIKSKNKRKKLKIMEWKNGKITVNLDAVCYYVLF